MSPNPTTLEVRVRVSWWIWPALRLVVALVRLRIIRDPDRAFGLAHRLGRAAVRIQIPGRPWRRLSATP